VAITNVDTTSYIKIQNIVLHNSDTGVLRAHGSTVPAAPPT